LKDGGESTVNEGDMVRFRERNEALWNLGILIEYKKWYKIAQILCEGKIVSVHAAHVQLHKRHPCNVEMLRKKAEKENQQERSVGDESEMD
jgi:hypothetical protein